MPLETKLRQLPEKVWVSALFLLLLLVALWLGLRWFWYFREAQSASPVAPRAEKVNLQAAINTISAQHLFGKPASQVQAGPIKVAAPPPVNVKLKGVFAATGVKPAYAILNVDGTDEAVKIGDEVEDGLVLEQVHPGHVVISRDDTQHEILLEAGAMTQGGTPGRPVAAAPPVAPRAGLPNIAGVPPKQQAPGKRPGVAATDEGAEIKPAPPAVINPAAGFKIDSVPQEMQKLGLKKGDVVSNINGQVVTSVDDLTRLYQQFSPLGQVIVEGTREGKPLRLSSSS
jgi:type II secretory pathway component PulC